MKPRLEDFGDVQIQPEAKGNRQQPLLQLHETKLGSLVVSVQNAESTEMGLIGVGAVDGWNENISDDDRRTIPGFVYEGERELS